MAELLEEPGQEAVGGEGSGDVGDDDRHPIAGLHDLPKGRGPDRAPDRLPKGRGLVRQAVDESRLDDGDLPGISTSRPSFPY